MSEGELLALIDGEERAAAAEGDLAQARKNNLKFYLAEEFGDEQEGSSRVVLPEVAEVVDNLIPSLLRIFTSVDNTVRFEPVGAEDEEAAQQETDVINSIYWRQNPGFLNTYTWLKDGLLSKVGIIKITWDESEKTSREEYEGLSDRELAELLDDDELEPIEQEERQGIIINDVQTQAGTGQVVETGTVHDVVFKRTRKTGRVLVEPVAPENFLISTDIASVNPSDARFVAQKSELTRSELIEAGFPKKQVMNLPLGHGRVDTEEEIARDHLSDTTEDPARVSRSEEKVEILEAYIRVDFDGDGISELRQVIRGGNEVLSNEAVDRQPFHAWTPSIMPHKFFGMCPADRALDIQFVKSTLVRQMLDNLYLTNNPQKYIWEAAITENTLDDLLNAKVGSFVRGGRPAQEALQVHAVPFVGQAAFPMLELFDDIKKKITGVGQDVQGLDVESLKNIQSTVVAQAFDMARMQIEATARIFAETGLKSAFRHIHELMRKHQDKEATLKLRSSWVKIDPSEWRERDDLTVLVGLGTGTREQKLIHLQAVAQLQQQYIQAGANGVVNLQNLFNTGAEFVKNADLKEPELFFNDPVKNPPQPQPDPQIQLAQQQLQQDAQENQIQAQKVMLEHQRKMEELEIKRQAELNRMEEAFNDFQAKLTEIEAKFNVDVPGSRI